MTHLDAILAPHVAPATVGRRKPRNPRLEWARYIHELYSLAA